MYNSKFQLETERLFLVCDTYEAMCLAAENGDELAQHFRNAYHYHSELADSGAFRKEDLIWYRTWTFYDKTNNRPIGGAIFKGEPNGKGYVEIGYGMYDEMQKRGYATEGNGRLISWAIDEMQVKGIIAETEKNNFASMRVLEKLGFERTHETDEFYYWLKRR